MLTPFAEDLALVMTMLKSQNIICFANCQRSSIAAVDCGESDVLLYLLLEMEPVEPCVC